MLFYLGTHETSWLRRLDVPLFVSHQRLRRHKTLPRALGPWALDSGGFTELSRNGGWQTTLPEYVAAVERYAAEVGNLQWAAPMDWMCEPQMLANTGLTVPEHQARTVANYLELRECSPLFVPVLQGWTEADYHACIERYDGAGVNLRALPLVGLGTVCRRQATPETARIISAIADYGIAVHGFGVKAQGLVRSAYLMASADSMAWSFGARRVWHHDRLQPCGGGHIGSCANCARWALLWRERVMAEASTSTPPSQGCLF